MLEIVVFWNVAPCSLVNIVCSFSVLTVSIISAMMIALMMETVRTSETSASIYQTTRRNILEDSHLHICRREN
jgi:ABC-type arginine/histidine transport system permease subunit